MDHITARGTAIAHRRSVARARRVVVILACAATTATTSSGCAAAVRALTVVDAVSTLHDVLTPPPSSSNARTSPAPGNASASALVTGTGKSGLRLERRPGSGRMSVWPDGSVVGVDCEVAGPSVTGPRGESAMWSRVTTRDGSHGFMSSAYLSTDSGVGGVPLC
jgi:hypothetical protein